jgi:hypothetical protein
MSEPIYDCHICEWSEKQLGDLHMRCRNPPPVQFEVADASEKTKRKLQKRLRKKLYYGKTLLYNPETSPIVVRCVWPSSGIYPFLFDANTVVACTNFKRKEEKK